MDNETMANMTSDESSQPVMVVDQEKIWAYLRGRRVERMYGDQYESNFHAASVFFALGLVTNVLNVAVLFRMSTSSSLNFLLASLSVTDILHLIIQFAHSAHFYAGFHTYPWYDWIVFNFTVTFLEGVFLGACAWLVASIGIWRFLVITWPLRSREYCTLYRAKLTVLLIYIASVIISCTLFFVNTTVQEEFLGRTVYDVDHSSLVTANDGLGLKIVFSIQMLKGVVPMIVILVMSFALIFNLYKIRVERKKTLNLTTSASAGHRTTIILLVLLLLNFLSNFPDNLVFFVGLCCKEELDQYLVHMSSIRFLSLISNSTTFFIYYALGADFRKATHKLFLKCITCPLRGKQIRESSTDGKKENRKKEGSSRTERSSSTTLSSQVHTETNNI